MTAPRAPVTTLAAASLSTQLCDSAGSVPCLEAAQVGEQTVMSTLTQG